jgi:hypothetical protein
MTALLSNWTPLAQISGGDSTGVILVMILLGLGFGLMMVFFSRYKRCPSNRILVVYGKTGRGAAKCVHGGAAFIWPLIQSYDFLDLEPFVVPIDLSSALSQENIRVTVPTTVTAAVSNQAGVMQNAAIRLLGLRRQQIQEQAQDIILGQMRAVIATMKIEEINIDRQAFLAKVNEAVSGELEKIGLALINVNIRDIDDESGYIKAIGRKPPPRRSTRPTSTWPSRRRSVRPVWPSASVMPAWLSQPPTPTLRLVRPPPTATAVRASPNSTPQPSKPKRPPKVARPASRPIES